MDKPEILDDDDLIAAIDEGIADADVKPSEPEPAAETPSPEVGVEPESESGTEPEPDAEGEPEPDAVETPKPKKDPDPAPEPQSDEGTKPAVPERPSDEFGALDKDVPEKTKERFEAIKSKYDALIEERDTVKAESTKWVETITSTGTNPEQFGMALEYLSAVNSGSRSGMEKAYSFMQEEMRVLAQALGKQAPGVYDPLSEHADLKERVDSGMLDESDALELVQARAAQRFDAASEKTRSEETQKQSMTNNALAEIRTLGEQLRSRDPFFQAKMPYLKPIIESVVAAGGPPSGWVAAVERAYRALPMPTIQPTAPAAPHAPNSIRPGTGMGAGLTKEPGSAMEALDMALERGY